MTDLRWSAFFLAVVFFVSGAFADEFNPGLAETVPTVTGSQIQNGGSRKTVGAPASASQLAWASADGCDAFGLNQTGYAPTAMSSGTIYDAADSTADSQGGFDFVFSAGQLNFPELAIRISRVTDHTTVIPLMNLSTDPWAGQRRLRFVSRKIRSHNAVEDALPVPEPNTIGLCCLGVLIIAWRVQQRGTNRQSMPGDFACLSATPVWRYRDLACLLGGDYHGDRQIPPGADLGMPFGRLASGRKAAGRSGRRDCRADGTETARPTAKVRWKRGGSDTAPSA